MVLAPQAINRGVRRAFDSTKLHGSFVTADTQSRNERSILVRPPDLNEIVRYEQN
jgi:hypothetical protein